MAKKFLKTFEILSNKAVVDLNVAILTLKSYEKGDVELDLENLIYLLEKNNIQSLDNINDLIPLSEYAVDGRYAVLHDDVEDADTYIKTLQEFIRLIKNKIEEKK